MRPMFKIAGLAFVLLLCLVNPARAGSLALVLSERDGIYSDFAGVLEQSLSGSDWHIVSSTAVSAHPPANARPDLIVTVGNEALRRTLARGENIPILATLLSRQNYERALSEAPRPASKVSAIYLDQPPARQSAFLRHLLPGQKRFGILLSNETRALASAYRQAFGNAGLTIDSEDGEDESNLLPTLNGLLGRVNALLALPDSTIYRRNNIKAILISSFRQQKPVIGFSAAFVNAGALAALHTTPNQIARQTSELIIASGLNLPPPSGPSQFAIAINPSVAQSLGLNIPDEATIRRAMLADRENR